MYNNFYSIQKNGGVKMFEKTNIPVQLRSGLLGYYFKDKDFKQLLFMDLCTHIGSCFTLGTSSAQSIRWLGRIKPAQTGEYKFFTPDCISVVMHIDGKEVINQNNPLPSIQLKQNQLYDVRIEYRLTQIEDINNHNNLQMFWSINSNEKESLPEDSLFFPDFSKKSGINRLSDHLFGEEVGTDQVVYAVEPIDSDRPQDSEQQLDSDEDFIPDHYEVDGYTVDKNKIVPWTEEHGKKGLIKYVSNPLVKNTAGDPYTDLEKVLNNMSGGELEEARHPLVAACPAVGMDMEKYTIVPDNDIHKEHAVSITKATSSSTTDSTSQEAGGSVTVSTSVTASIDPSVTVGVSATLNSSHSSSTSTCATTDDTTGKTFSEQIGYNTSRAAYLYPHIRVFNNGTAPIDDVKPSFNVVLNDATIQSITFNESQMPLTLPPGETYPQKSQHPLLISKTDQFNSAPNNITEDNLNSLQQGHILQLETTQVGGTFSAQKRGLQDKNPANLWTVQMSNIKQRTAHLVIQTKDEILERWVAAPSSEDPESQATPMLTIGEALILAFPKVKKENNTITYNGVDMLNNKDALTAIILDPENNKKILDQNQLIFDVKLEQGMAILFNLNYEEEIKKAFVFDKWVTSSEFGVQDGVIEPGYDNVDFLIAVKFKKGPFEYIDKKVKHFEVKMNFTNGQARNFTAECLYVNKEEKSSYTYRENDEILIDWEDYGQTLSLSDPDTPSYFPKKTTIQNIQLFAYTKSGQKIEIFNRNIQ